ncbi:hypothetical protein DPMN_047475 [Dreissena polymorpha]|uniref:Uncharacterized protein n=1 Tax=Dreissena polymorpha TaxID=45954 RepID=A0A9D4D9V3_DREPO|nr:hypothetical protein DPMN_047475 [Dreissena polymorpha]
MQGKLYCSLEGLQPMATFANFECRESSTAVLRAFSPWLPLQREPYATLYF